MNIRNLYKHHLIKIARTSSNAPLQKCIREVDLFIDTKEGIKGPHAFELGYRSQHLKINPIKKLGHIAEQVEDRINPIAQQMEY